MSQHSPARRWSDAVPAWLRPIGVANLVFTAVLVPVGVALALDPENHGSATAAVLLTLTVTSLLVLRSTPALAPWLLAAGTLTTQLVSGPLVTCGVVLPALCIIAFQLAGRTLPVRSTVVGALGLAATTTAEAVYDPVLGAEGGVFIAGIALSAWCAGLLLRSRARMVATLRQRTADLTHQRELTAQVAVDADRARIRTELQDVLRHRIRSIADSAEAGREHLRAGRADASVAALQEAEAQGRETLASMRDVVGVVREPPTEPLPQLCDLPALLERATTAAARLTVEGEPRALAPHLEVCAYRIVEQLLDTLNADPRARVDVRVRFQPTALHLQVAGSPARPTAAADMVLVTAALEAARARADVAGGRLTTTTPTGRRLVDVVLPVPAAAA